MKYLKEAEASWEGFKGASLKKIGVKKKQKVCCLGYMQIGGCAELSIVVAVVEQIYFLQFCGTSLVFGGKMKKKDGIWITRQFYFNKA